VIIVNSTGSNLIDQISSMRNLMIIISLLIVLSGQAQIFLDTTVIIKKGSSSLDYSIGDSSTVIIGSQEWISKNLNVERFANGDVIPHVKTPEEWKSAADNKQPAWCYFNNDPTNGLIYGKLYNWYAVNDPRGLAPKGWHIPSDNDWDDLIRHLAKGRVEVNKPLKTSNGNATQYVTEQVGSLLKSVTDWSESGNGNNKSGMVGLPGGSRYPDGRFSSHVREYCDWWSSSESTSEKAMARYLYFKSNDVFKYDYNKGCGFSVRCLKD
jgi:uncharacterized protein (TIGR02145 family)